MEKLNVAIADDNERMLRLLGDIIESDDELNVVGVARDGEEAYHVIKAKEPDVVLLDIVMPKLDGLGVIDRVSQGHLHKKASGVYYDQRDRSGENHGRCVCARRRLLHYEAV